MAAGVLSAATPAIVLFITPGSLIPVIKRNSPITSDIDIAVSGIPDTENLREELDNLPTLYTIDLVNLDECGNQLLLEDIRKYGREIYKKI